MHEIEIDIVRPQSSQRLLALIEDVLISSVTGVEGFRADRLEGGPCCTDFRSDIDLAAVQTLESLADHLLGITSAVIRSCIQYVHAVVHHGMYRVYALIDVDLAVSVSHGPGAYAHRGYIRIS